MDKLDSDKYVWCLSGWFLKLNCEKVRNREKKKSCYMYIEFENIVFIVEVWSSFWDLKNTLKYCIDSMWGLKYFDFRTNEQILDCTHCKMPHGLQLVYPNVCNPQQNVTWFLIGSSTLPMWHQYGTSSGRKWYWL